MVFGFFTRKFVHNFGIFGVKMKSVAIVTGGAGFLGSHICDRLLAMDLDVYSVDNYITGNKKNLDSRVKQINADVTSAYHVSLGDMLVGRDVKFVFNFACPASPPKYQRFPIHTMLTSVLGTKHGLELASIFSAKFIQASTSEIYGDPEVHPQVESYRGCVNSFGPRACYDEGKRAAEALCYDFGKEDDVDVRIVRIFNTYGPRMDPNDGRVVTNFINQALRGEKITLYGDGLQTRSFCYVDDLIDGILKLALIATNGTLMSPINIGNPSEFTMKQLAQHVIHNVRLMGGLDVDQVDLEGLIEYRDLPVDDPTKRRPDITRAKSVLMWEPKINLMSGLSKTIEYFKMEMEND